jgi:BetI-type transcriptional repressor, C-terminal
MERISEDREGYMLRIEFGLFALRDPRLRDRFAAQLVANRDLLGEIVSRRVEQVGTKPPLPPDRLASVIRALGIGLAIEKTANPDAIPEELYADAVEWIVRAAGLS